MNLGNCLRFGRKPLDSTISPWYSLDVGRTVSPKGLMMEIVKLKNGSEAPDFVVTAHMASLRSLFDIQPIAFYELVMVARDPAHQPCGNSGQILRSLHLIDPNGGMHDTTKDIILSAVDGDEVEMRLVSPVRQID